MKRQSKLQTAPQPISLIGRKNSIKANPVETPPYRIQWDSPKLRPIENHLPISSASLISNMKQELSSIKLDVEKLISSEEPLESKLTQKMDIFNQSLKDELAYQKKVEEQLRKEVRELKLKLSDPKPRQERLAFERKMEELKADKFKSDREKQVFQERLVKLQGELAEAQRFNQSKDEVKSGKVQQLMREYEKVQAEKKRLQAENAQLQQQLQNKPAKVQTVDRQVQFSNTEQHMKLRNGMHELEKEKLALAGRLHDKEEELSKVTTKYQAALKETEAKYYNAIAEFRSLEDQLRAAKDNEVSSLNQRVENLEEEVGELAKLNLQLCQQNDELTLRASKKEKESEVSNTEALRRENGELMAVVAKLKQAYQLQQTENDQLQAKFMQLQSQMTEIQSVEVETLKDQISVLEDNIQTLHSNYEKRLDDYEEASRTAKSQYAEKVNELAAGKRLAEEEIQVLRRKIQQAYTEYLLGKESEQQNANKNRPKSNEIGCQTIGMEPNTKPSPKPVSTKHNLGTQTIRHATLAGTCQTDPLPVRIAPSTDSEELEEQLRVIRVENVNLAIEINHLNKEILRLHEQLRSSNEFSREKDAYIVELERQKQILEAVDYHKEMQNKCQQLAEEHSKVIEDYQIKIMRLENEVEQLRDKNLRRSRSSSVHTQDTVNFDSALKLQLAENDQLKVCLRQKQQEMLEMRSQVEEWRRKAQALRTQTEIDKLRGVSEQKTLKSHYDITIQNIKQDLQSMRRKQQTLQRKVDFKCDELRKKDEFIQQVIIGKVGRDAQQSELDYTKKELERLFTANYEQRLFNALERIRELEDHTM